MVCLFGIPVKTPVNNNAHSVANEEGDLSFLHYFQGINFDCIVQTLLDRLTAWPVDSR